MQKRLVYPSQAVRERAEGRVFIKFTIAITGLIQDAEVIKGFRPDCDATALQAVQKLPKFRPVSRAGKPVASSLTMPVKFTLPITPPKIAK
ncbi:energy transducer TonB [Hymenobacter setariae]|uniref:Energy transducer TonB n=1 Tax=Hymenobacter setariae TaxID=2594794 RepID=A0A558BW79_9BACT|nr:energy transducer TonB [Hymenobacter setariae]